MSDAYVVDDATEEILKVKVIPKFHIGENVYVQICTSKNMVDIRRYWIPPGDAPKDRSISPFEFEVQPTRMALRITISQWRCFRAAFTQKVIALVLDVNGDYRTCESSHQAQTSLLRCKHCNPNGYQEWRA